MTKKIIGNKYFIFSTIIILVWGVNFTLNQSLMFPVLAVNYVIMAFIIYYPLCKSTYDIKISKYWPLILYLCWFGYALVRGLNDCNSTVKLKFVLDYLFATLLSLFVFFPENMSNYRNLIRCFWKYGLLVAIFLWPFNVSYSFYFHYLILIIPLWKYLTNTKRLLIVCIVIYSLRYLDPRAHVPKYLIDLLLFILPYSLLKDKLIKLLHPLLLVVPIILLITGITGLFNPFNMESYVDTNVKIQQRGETLDATVDTRTVIYEDVILSAVNNDYIFTGRNLANGNDSRFVLDSQRDKNEASILNHFTKMGLVGVCLFYFLFIYSSYLAIYRSNNHWVKLIGLYVAFRWIIVWIEDPELFGAMYLSIWLMMGICISSNFRRMNDFEIANYLRTFFK